MSVKSYDDVAQLVNENPQVDIGENGLKKLTFLKILKESNVLKQQYHVISNEKESGFFITYKIKMNIFTLSKWRLDWPVTVIGVPCSISKPGFLVPNSLRLKMFEEIQKMKGAKLVLNCPFNMEVNHFGRGYTLPTCLLEVKWKTIDEYMGCLRSHYRYRLRKASDSLSDVESIHQTNLEFTEELYRLYLNVFEKSAFKLEKLEINFFQKLESKIIRFNLQGKAVGFVQLYGENDTLYFLFCGIDYHYKNTADLYLQMVLEVVKYGIKHSYKWIDLGQTTEETKTRFGAKVVEKYFYVNHSNTFIQWLIKKNIKLLEYPMTIKNHRVIRENSRVEDTFN